MEYDVRTCKKEEAVVLFNKVTSKLEPYICTHDENNRIYIHYKWGDQRLIYWVELDGRTTFQFYTGIDNIRFDGELTSDKCVAYLKKKSLGASGFTLVDFIKLGDENGRT